MTLHPWSLSIQIGTETPYDIDLSALAAQRPDGVGCICRKKFQMSQRQRAFQTLSRNQL